MAEQDIEQAAKAAYKVIFPNHTWEHSPSTREHWLKIARAMQPHLARESGEVPAEWSELASECRLHLYSKQDIERVRSLATELLTQHDLRPAPVASDAHDYLSTACYHGNHGQCRKTCKFCSTVCKCSCHISEDATKARESGAQDQTEWSITPDAEDAAFIVEAVNAHDSLLAELATLKIQLADPAAVHANILRGTIALTKAAAIHIAGLPADIEQQLADANAQVATLAQQLTDEIAKGLANERQIRTDAQGKIEALRRVLTTPLMEVEGKAVWELFRANLCKGGPLSMTEDLALIADALESKKEPKP